MKPPARRGSRGYSLLEVIVAFALLAAGLSLLLGTLSGGARQVRWSGDAGRAALHAQSLIDQVGLEAPLKDEQRSGEFEDGRYRWNLVVKPWRDPSMAGQPQPPGARPIFEVALSVEWGEGESGGRRLQMRSLRLGQPDANAVLTQ